MSKDTFLSELQYERGISPLLAEVKHTWFVSGVAGFIGSHLASCLLRHGQKVIGLDNFSTGKEQNLASLESCIPSTEFASFQFIEGDLSEVEVYRDYLQQADFVLHQAALGSVPRSINDPVATNRSNVDGFVQLASCAAQSGIKRFVYASSSSVYGDHPGLPKKESEIGRALSPYAVSKRTDELYAEVFAEMYSIPFVGLRYFNVFGPRQDPEGAYAAVIPRWLGEMISGAPQSIFGDGSTSRDFCFVENVVQANIRAALCGELLNKGVVFNVGAGKQTSDRWELKRFRF